MIEQKKKVIIEPKINTKSDDLDRGKFPTAQDTERTIRELGRLGGNEPHEARTANNEENAVKTLP